MIKGYSRVFIFDLWDNLIEKELTDKGIIGKANIHVLESP